MNALDWSDVDILFWSDEVRSAKRRVIGRRARVAATFALMFIAASALVGAASFRIPAEWVRGTAMVAELLRP